MWSGLWGYTKSASYYIQDIIETKVPYSSNCLINPYSAECSVCFIENEISEILVAYFGLEEKIKLENVEVKSFQGNENNDLHVITNILVQTNLAQEKIIEIYNRTELKIVCCDG